MSVPDQRFVARVGGVEFVGRMFDNTPGFYVQEVEGLLGGGVYSNNSVQRIHGTGEYDLDSDLNGPRVITLKGFIYGASLWELGRMVNQLSGLVAGQQDRADFVWSEFGETYWVNVKRGSGGGAKRRGNTGRATFTVRFRAASQVFYGERREVDGSVVKLINRGNFAADPVVYVFGPTPGYSLWSGDKRVTVTQSLTAGQFHRIEFESGRLFRDNVLQVGGISRLETWTVPPGGELFMEVTGAPSMRVRVTDTYI